MRGTYTINETELNDPDGRWYLEAATRSPTPSGTEISLVTSPGMHGAHLAGKRARKPATLALSIGITGKTHAELRENFQELLLLLSSWESDGILTIEYDDGETTTWNQGLVSSDLNPTELADKDLILPLTMTLPNPFWEDRTQETLHPNNRQETLWGALTGGSAPVEPTIHIKSNDSTPITNIRLECLTTHHTATWTGKTTELYWHGWNVTTALAGDPDRALGFGVESMPVLYPNSQGDYRFVVEVSGGGQSPLIELTGARRFQ